MFTGIVEAVGVVRSIEPFGEGREMTIEAPSLAGELVPGESVSVDGVCLTVVEPLSDGFTVQSIATTLARTIIGEYEEGRRVNLERAMALGDRLGGHIVQGHVDGVGEVVTVARHDDHVLVDLAVPPEIAELTILHGSITVNGVSMTVNDLPEQGIVQISIIPFTLEHTNFSELQPGVRVNLEADMIGKFVRSLISCAGGAEAYRKLG